MTSTGQSHLHASEYLPPDYSRVIRTWLWLYSKKLLEKDPVGLDSHKCFTKMHENRNVEDAIRIQIQVLDDVLPEKTFEEFTDRNC
jgi:hypothetical protein